MKIGYCRVSTNEQTVQSQMDALEKEGCERIFTEIASGSRSDRPVLQEAVDFLRAEDTLVVVRLDRAARSLSHLLNLLNDFDQRGIGFHSLSENIDTSSAGGRLVFNIFGSIAEFEKDLIRERTRAGLAAARKRGRVGGRPKTMTDDKRDAALKLLEAGTAAKDVATAIGVSLPMLYRHCPVN
ncbi:MAG: recombinase family protein [Lentilitoribacter sp.]